MNKFKRFPKSLFQIAGNALNTLPKPMSWSWTVSDVTNWVRYGLKLPQYATIFKDNKINGKKLILINCQTLPNLYITDFEHMKYIAKNVRRLYGVPPDTEFNNRRVGGRRNVHDVYGRYYAHLASGAAHTSLFDYARSTGMVVRRPRWPDAVLFARQPAAERAQRVAVLRICGVPRRPHGPRTIARLSASPSATNVPETSERGGPCSNTRP